MGRRSRSAEGVSAASRSWRTFAECRRTLLGRRFGRLFCDSGSGVEIRVASASAGLSIEVQETEIVHEMFQRICGTYSLRDQEYEDGKGDEGAAGAEILYLLKTFV